MAKALEWTTRRVVIRQVVSQGVFNEGSSQVPAVAEVGEPASGTAFWSTASIIIVAVILGLSIFFPPVLLLNLPILLLRAALVHIGGSRRQQVSLPEFACPVCGKAQSGRAYPGTLPLDIACTDCQAPLSVTQAPRRNLLDDMARDGGAGVRLDPDFPAAP